VARSPARAGARAGRDIQPLALRRCAGRARPQARPEGRWKPRYDFINEWEKLLAIENSTTILKFFLYISREEQLARFKERLDDPGRQWKISNSDYTERNLWDEYIDAFETALSRCSTKYAPWFVIPSNHKWFRNLAVSQIIADTLDDMNLKLPKPTVDLEEIRRLYHKDTAVENTRIQRARRRANDARPLLLRQTAFCGAFVAVLCNHAEIVLPHVNRQSSRSAEHKTPAATSSVVVNRRPNQETGRSVTIGITRVVFF
jgi:Polyphosphate kinase 2 (PPK2)